MIKFKYVDGKKVRVILTEYPKLPKDNGISISNVFDGEELINMIIAEMDSK